MLGSVLVQLQACVAQLLRQLIAELLLQLRVADVLVMAGIGLRRGREDRVRELLALLQPWRHILAGQRARLLVLLPGAPGKVAPHDALEVDALGLAHDHESAGELLAMVAKGGRQVGHHARHEVVLLERVRLREPEDGQLRQHLAAVGDAGGQHMVEGRQPVCRDHQELVVGQLVRVTHLAPREKLEGQLGAADRRPGDHGRRPRREIRGSRGRLPLRAAGTPADGEQRSERIGQLRERAAEPVNPKMGRMGPEDPPRASGWDRQINLS